ncbi:unnamed protein product [Paramecium pentaurelia]|uniref:Uncharacterized protein n=1 Tax=Paramecium pentaurelia TaxID=43138 RepID=A0A8S1X9T3_9CILI|nr:unnamed protein product [Paramecium pentaurelia]
MINLNHVKMLSKYSKRDIQKSQKRIKHQHKNDIDDLILQKWKFLLDDQREPYKKNIEKTQVKLTQIEVQANYSDKKNNSQKKLNYENPQQHFFFIQNIFILFQLIFVTN